MPECSACSISLKVTGRHLIFDRAFVRVVDADRAFHQRRFARAIFPISACTLPGLF